MGGNGALRRGCSRPTIQARCRYSGVPGAADTCENGTELNLEPPPPFQFAPATVELPKLLFLKSGSNRPLFPKNRKKKTMIPLRQQKEGPLQTTSFFVQSLPSEVSFQLQRACPSLILHRNSLWQVVLGLIDRCSNANSGLGSPATAFMMGASLLTTAHSSRLYGLRMRTAWNRANSICHTFPTLYHYTPSSITSSQIPIVFGIKGPGCYPAPLFCQQWA